MRRGAGNRRSGWFGAADQSAASAAAAAASTAARYVPRSAGPPAPLPDTILWTLVSLAGYLCFVVLPALAGRNPMEQALASSSAGDLRAAGHYLHICVWMWPVYDLALRALCYAMLPVSVLVKARLVFIPTTQEQGSASVRSGTVGAGVPSLDGSFLQTLFPPVRALLGVEPLHASRATVATAAAAAGGPSELLFSTWAYREVVVVCCVVFAVVWFAVVFQTARRRWHRPRNAQPLVPVLCWMVLWSLGFATCFAWVRAMPLLISVVYPTSCGLLILYSLFVP